MFSRDHGICGDGRRSVTLRTSTHTEVQVLKFSPTGGNADAAFVAIAMAAGGKHGRQIYILV